MRTLKLGVLIVVIATLLVFGTVSTALGDYWQNQWVHNNTGRVANDLEKFVNGNILVSSWYSTLFHGFTYLYDYGQNMTTVRWYSGTVNPCQWTYVCFKTNQPRVTYRYLPRWSFDGVPGPIVGPVLSADLQMGVAGTATLKLSNDAIDAGPMTVGIIQVAPTKVLYPLDWLKWINLDTLPWATTMNNIPVKMGQVMPIPPIPMPSDAVGVIYRARIWLDSDPSNIVEDVIQISPLSSPK